jgi:hypothetical protein
MVIPFHLVLSAAVNILEYVLILRLILSWFFLLLLHCHRQHYHQHSIINSLARCWKSLDYREPYCPGFCTFNLILYCFLTLALERNINFTYVCAGLTLESSVIHDCLQRDRDYQENLVSTRFLCALKISF